MAYVGGIGGGAVIDVLVSDGRPGVRDVVVRALSELDFVGSCLGVSSGPELLAQCRRHLPDAVFIGRQRSTDGGIDTVKQLLASYPALKIVVMGELEDTVAVAATAAVGARAYVAEDASMIELVATCVATGVGVAGTAFVIPAPSDEPDAQRPGSMLTEREVQVLERIALGMSNAQIAHELFLVEDTIKTHARTLYRKLGARDRAHAVALGLRAQII